jgi:hypothetical protein
LKELLLSACLTDCVANIHKRHIKMSRSSPREPRRSYLSLFLWKVCYYRRACRHVLLKLRHQHPHTTHIKVTVVVHIFLSLFERSLLIGMSDEHPQTTLCSNCVTKIPKRHTAMSRSSPRKPRHLRLFFFPWKYSYYRLACRVFSSNCVTNILK